MLNDWACRLDKEYPAALEKAKVPKTFAQLTGKPGRSGQ
jgi:hypothetical protein